MGKFCVDSDNECILEGATGLGGGLLRVPF